MSFRRSFHYVLLGTVCLSCLSAPLPALAGADVDAARKAVRLRQFEQAFSLYEKAAQAGHPDAQYEIAMLYARGRGTEKNDNRARLWLERAARQGHPGASYLLSQKLRDNDPERADTLLQSAAVQGYATAAKHLEFSSNGSNQGAPDATTLAARWFNAARSDDTRRLETLLEQGADLTLTNAAGRNALFIAVESGSKRTVRWLIRQQIDVNHRDKFGLSAAQTALESRQPDMLKILLEAGADTAYTMNNGDNLLHYALRLNQTDSAQLLIRHGVAVNQKNKQGWTPLDIAQHKNMDRAVTALQRRQAVNGAGSQPAVILPNVQLLAEQMSDASTLSPLASAVVNGNNPLLEQLVKRNPDSLHEPLPDGLSLLGLAVRHNDPAMVATLLALGADVNAGAYRGMTALHVAARLEQDDMLETLLDHGADPLIQDDTGRDVIHAAIDQKRDRQALVLLQQLQARGLDRKSVKEHGVPVDTYLLSAVQHRLGTVIDELLPLAGHAEAVDNAGRNALWFAARDMNSALVKRLLQAGVSPVQTDKLGRTPFLIAVEHGCRDCAQLLLPLDDVNRQTASGNTALMTAAHNGDHQAVRWLIDQGAELEIRNQQGNTAIMEAVNGNAIAVVKTLVEANANVSRKNRFGSSAVDLAKQVSPEMLSLVRSRSVLGFF